MLYRIITSNKCENFIVGTAFTEKELERMVKADRENPTTYTRQCLQDVLKNSAYGEVSNRVPFKCFGVRLIATEDFELIKWN